MKAKNVKKGFEAFYRTDTEQWNYYTLLLGAIFLLPIRFIAGISLVIAYGICFYILLIGHDMSKPVTGLRLKLMSIICNKIICRLILFGCGVHRVTTSKREYDYTKYLGEGYKSQEPEGYASSFSNHSSWLDVILFLWKTGGCGFISRKYIRDIPIVGIVAEKLNSVFVERTSSREEKNKGVKVIEDNQKRIMDHKGQIISFHAFAEGATTNGETLVPFKRGLFNSLLPLKPFGLKYTSSWGNPSLDIFPFGSHVLFTLMQVSAHYELIELPVYFPTNHLYKNYKHLGEEKWEIYSSSIR